jgi:histidinol-phosphate/aromatic aminotransferase/cobyric acid decarboxylase-like protein
MQADAPVHALFQRASHNPSFFQVRSATQFAGPLLDFCVPVNPYFPPREMSDRIKEHLGEILKYYPDYAQTHQEAIADFTGLPTDCIVAANGSTEIITSVCRDVGGPIVTPVPTFGRWTDLPIELNIPIHFIARRKEHGFRIHVDEMAEKVARHKATVAVICNPDNPTGASMSFEEARELILRLKDLPLLIIDESFIDFSGIRSAASLALESSNTVIVKSMGKSLGWHGIRLGYAVANKQLAARMRKKLPYWNINGLASFVLKNLSEFRSAYLDSFYRIAQDREALFNRLQPIKGLTTFASAANFLYCELGPGHSGPALRTRLLEEHGILARECGNKLGSTQAHLRFAVLPQGATERLGAALEECLG